MHVVAPVKNALLGLAVFLAVTLFIEGLIRAGTTVAEDIRRNSEYIPEDWFEYSPELGWVRKANYTGHVSGAERRFGEDGYLVSDSAGIADTVKPKVLFIGDSNTFGYAVPSESSFAAVVERLLPEVNSINLGVNGYTSYQGSVAFARYTDRLKADIAVVSFNFNDRRYVFSRDEVDGAERFRRIHEQSTHHLRKQVLDFLENSFLYRSMRAALRAVRILPPGRKETRVDVLLPRVTPGDYRENLVKIADEARRRGIPLVFVLLRDNPIESMQLRKGVDLYERSAYEDATAYLRIAVDMNNMYSDLARLYLSKAYEKRGEIDKANEAVVSRSLFLSLHGGRPVMLDSEYNMIMRDVATQYNVELVDAGEVLDEDPSVYTDFCHFDERGHRRAGQLIADRIALMLKQSGRQSSSPVITSLP